jgi:hypothetical protein
MEPLSARELASVPVEVATEADVAAFTDRALAQLGMTYQELEAAAGDDEDELPDEARRVWFAIKPLQKPEDRG